MQRDGLWLLSGLESGGINLQSVRHDEGKQIACLRQHTSAVSVLNLAQDERSVLSGSWDKSIIDWDLNTGQAKQKFEGSGGQISALEIRPSSSLSVPEASGEVEPSSSTFSSNNIDKPATNGVLPNGDAHGSKEDDSQDYAMANAPGSPADSLFGGNDSLFGDNEDGETAAPSGGNFVDDDDDEFSRAVANGVQGEENIDAEGDVDMMDGGAPTVPSSNEKTNERPSSSAGELHQPAVSTSEQPLGPAKGLPHADELALNQTTTRSSTPAADSEPTADTIFLAASFDGGLRIWDKRRPTPVAKIPPRNVPPWCMNACWSPNGNFIYAGRRNGTVEEFSLHKGLTGVERSFKLPNGSGPVSAVRAMPNGRHLIW